MTVSITVLYPNSTDAKFDMSYYLSKHMPLVQDRWAPHGLQDWRITEFNGSPGDEKVPYSVEAKLLFESTEKFEQAQKAAGKEVFGDIPNFCNSQPLILVGELKGKQS